MCSRIGVDESGRPYCVHGPMIVSGYKKSGYTNWTCGETKRLSNKRGYDRIKNTIKSRRSRNRLDQEKIELMLSENPWLKELGYG